MKSIELPFDEAVVLAAKENYSRDRRMGLIGKASSEDMSMYEEEAKQILATTGENYLPEYKDHHHIKVKK